MTQVTETHRRSELVKFGIARDLGIALLRRHAEVLLQAQLFGQSLIMIRYSAALYGIKHLGGVKTEHRRVAEISRASVSDTHTECVGRVVYDL